MYRVPRYRLLLVKDGPAISTTWDRQVRQARDVAEFMQPIAAGLDREHFWCLLLDTRNKLLGVNTVSVGSLSSALVHPREVWKPAIIGNAAAVVLCHNHPSGDASPSTEDFALTQRLNQCAETLGIPLLDHIVLGHDGAYRSLADDGVLGGAR